MYIYIHMSPPWHCISQGSLEFTRPGRDLVTSCRSSGSTPRGRKPVTVCSRRAVLLPVAVALSSRLLLCRTLGCSRSATPLPPLLRHHTTWAQACDCVFSSFFFWFGGDGVSGSWCPLRLVCRCFPVNSCLTARWATFVHAWRGYLSVGEKEEKILFSNLRKHT